MQRLARPIAPREEAEHDPSGVFQSGFAPLLHTDPRLPAGPNMGNVISIHLKSDASKLTTSRTLVSLL